jgi:hypothetical protein
MIESRSYLACNVPMVPMETLELEALYTVKPLAWVGHFASATFFLSLMVQHDVRPSMI